MTGDTINTINFERGRNMKKLICIILAMLFVGLTFAGCADKTDDNATTTAATTKETETLSAEWQALAGKKIAVQEATTADDYVTELKDQGKLSFEIRRYEKITQCYDDLKLGRVDAVLVDKVVSDYYSNGNSAIKRAWANSAGEPLGICLKKGNDDLRSIVETTIDTLYFDGTFATVATKFFGSNVTKDVRTVTAKPTLDLSKLKTIKTGTLLVGMEVGYPPMEFTDDSGTKNIGFDVEIAQKMADLLGLKLEIVNTAWTGIFAALDKGEFDMIISSVSITEARQANYNMTKPYISNALVLDIPA